MDGEEEERRRWTCDACGCNTNIVASDRNCTICGTSQNPLNHGAGVGGASSIRRRGAGSRMQALRSGWLARHQDGSFEGEVDIWDSVLQGLEPPPIDPAQFVTAARNRLVANESARQRLLEAASRAFSQAAHREADPMLSALVQLPPEELLRVASSNAPIYQPTWADPATLVSANLMASTSTRSSRSAAAAAAAHSYTIEVSGGAGDGMVGHPVAHVPLGGTEGRSIRAEPPFPRTEASHLFDPFHLSPTNSNDSGNLFDATTDIGFATNAPRSRVSGFRVVFDHPTAMLDTDDDALHRGSNLGGCFLVGVTSSAFTSYNESSALQQSNVFWGIEDHGQIFEGTRVTHASNDRPAGRATARSRLHAEASLFGVDLGSRSGDTAGAPVVPMNAHAVLFGSREVITVVCDLDSRTLTFWRDETLLGTLVSNLPSTGNLYPVVVPFNAGVAVAITGLNMDPLPLLRSFAANWREQQNEKHQKIRNRLAKERANFIKWGKPTLKLQQVLRLIFRMYSHDAPIDDVEMDNISLTPIMAARLWCRCGIKLSLLENMGTKNGEVQFSDFLQLIEQLIDEDEKQLHLFEVSERHMSLPELAFEVGDKVELAEGYEKYGDAACGPLQIGDRGIVVEVQKGPNGEKRSVRVLHSGRRWYYQPQAVVSERSGLIESPVVWFLNGLLRSHGFDHMTLISIVGKPVTPSSWKIGDIVAPKVVFNPSNKYSSLESSLMIGRLVPETAILSSSLSTHVRQSGTVVVEFVGREFAEAVGIKASGLSPGKSHETRRIRTNRLVHTSELHGSRLSSEIVGSEACDDIDNMELDSAPSDSASLTSELNPAAVNENVLSDIESMRCLDRSAIDSLSKECRKSSDALAIMFSAGLPEAIMSAISVVERQMNSLEPKDDLPDNLAAVGNLVNAIAEQLYCKNVQAQESEEMETELTVPQRITPWQNMPRNVQNREQIQQLRTNSANFLRGDDRRGDSQVLASSLQQRRNVLLSFMSRASRGSDAGVFLSDVAEGGIDSFGPLPPSLAQLRGAAPFVYEPPGDFLDLEEQMLIQAGSPHHAADSSGMDDEHNTVLTQNVTGLIDSRKFSLLDSILRCYGPVTSIPLSGNMKQGGAAYAVFIRHFVKCGVLVDSAKWAEALINGHCKNVQLGNYSKGSTLLRGVVDEEGTPILMLAILLGCNADLISLLIKNGAHVGNEAIVKAALTNQTKTLLILLRNASFEDGTIDLELCSPAVRRILDRTKSRQDELSRKMMDTAGSFMVRLLLKLFEVGLSFRHTHTARTDLCSKVMCEMLLGNVLLRALQVSQNATRDISQLDREQNLGPSELAENGATKEICFDLALLPQGLLSLLPQVVLHDFLFSQEDHLTKFLLLCEDYLCSKEMADVASGLSFLSIILTKFPQLRVSSEIKRFGISEFVANHNVLSSNRIADILSKQLNIGLDVSSSSPGTGDDSRSTSNFHNGCVVLCPKKHTAVLHITRHSSFRCDLCGCAVPKGEYIFGCRQCDYDECLQCTLRDEKRTLGVQMMIRELASDCSRILSDEVTELNPVVDGDVVSEPFSRCDEVKALNVRLLKRDLLAIKDLCDLLTKQGCITIHEFLTSILPSLHSSLLGQSSSGDTLLNNGVAAHRSKKARASRSTLDVTPEARLEYCRQALRHLIADCVKPAKKCTVAKASLSNKFSECSPIQDEDEIRNEDDEDKGTKVNISYSPGASELLRRLHQVLSFYESVRVFATSSSPRKISGQPFPSISDDLHSLTKPFELLLMSSVFDFPEKIPSMSRSFVYVEPLVSFADIQLHILRLHRIKDANYLSFCQRLAADKAIIVERPKTKSTGSWRIARVERFDENTGGHQVCYASGWKRGQERFSTLLDLSYHDYSCFTFSSQLSLVLAAREYYTLARKQSTVSCWKESNRSHENGMDLLDSVDAMDGPHRLVQAIGSRVESSCRPGNNWDILTLVGIDIEASKGSMDGTMFILVSDDGELFTSVPADQIRARGNIIREESTRPGRLGRLTGDDRSSLFPFLAIRDRSDVARGDHDGISAISDSHNHTKALRRTWSALSLLDEMRPVDLSVSADLHESQQNDMFHGRAIFECKLEESSSSVVVATSSFETPPTFSVQLSTHDKLPTLPLTTSPDKTFFSALKELHEKQEKWSEWPPKQSCRLFFSVTVAFSEHPCVHDSLNVQPPVVDSPSCNVGDALSVRERRSRRASSSLTMDEERDREGVSSLCDGVDEICVQCMEVISVLSDCAEDPTSPIDRDVLNLPGFSNSNLSKKLTAQMDQILCCVGSSLPEWCIIACSFAPHVFTYESRRLLLERTAFGPSRSALCQQEAKVNVGKLRQRMASLRARAVELVGEAFAGGAEDPTALQLQADELYGMEEALAARVRAAFRAVKWQEHALQVAKAAVRRDRLLADASAVMESYTNDRSVCRRRLEVRFEGESGFDAASGDEAGVTRGFFADVAEALLSVNIVAGVCCSSSCGHVAKLDSSSDQPIEVIEIDEEAWKLPLWIPDMDSSGQVIIPTPRAAKDSGLGVFPRPIPPYHPQFEAVVKMFRLMGRLFAAAMRDGFMFPVPLSSAFLKLVQHGNLYRRGCETCRHLPLLSGDLPRPGFLGGEVFAADFYVCRQLDRVDASNPPLSRHDLKRAYEDIATDKSFARSAFGRSYDCSFEEYFQDRTFVDPIDPAQDADAAPLCPKGYAKAITIYNIREWVALAKNFMLHDGVIEQALAFRKGVDDFFSADYLRVFTSEELQRDVCGVGDDVDQWNEASIRKLFKLDGGNGAAEALVAVAAMGGEGGAAMSRRFGPSSPTIAFLVQALSEASVTQRRQFLNFVTSVPIAVKAHWIEVVPILSPSGEFLPMHDPSCLPRANTCSRRLYLPRFETYESFSDVLWAVVREESKFKGFYEWRGN